MGNSATHCAAASDFTTNYCNAKHRLGNILVTNLFGFISKPLLLKIFSTRADVASGEYFKEDPVWQQMQQFVYVAACHLRPNVQI